MRDHNGMGGHMRNSGEQCENPVGHDRGYNRGNNENRGYKDIINLPHHVSKTHPHMSITERAAQFSPFAALTGHGDAIRETARLTEGRIFLDEDMLVRLDEKLAELARLVETGDQPETTVTYFEADERKEGGAYRTKTGRVKQVDPAGRKVIFTDRMELEIKNILDIEITLDSRGI